MHQRSNSLRRQHAGPGVENLHRVDAGLELADADSRPRPRTSTSISRAKASGCAIGEQPRRRLIRRALPGHHVGRDRPRRAAKADQRRLAIAVADFTRAHRLIDRRQHLAIDGLAHSPKRRGIRQRLEPRSFAGHELNLAAERVRNHQNIGKQDRRIEAEAPDRLQRHFRGEFRSEAKIEKAARFLPHRPIFRQIASGLPHQPDRRHGFALLC